MKLLEDNTPLVLDEEYPPLKKDDYTLEQYDHDPEDDDEDGDVEAEAEVE